MLIHVLQRGALSKSSQPRVRAKGLRVWELVECFRQGFQGLRAYGLGGLRLSPRGLQFKAFASRAVAFGVAGCGKNPWNIYVLRNLSRHLHPYQNVGLAKTLHPTRSITKRAAKPERDNVIYIYIYIHTYIL